MFLAFFNDGERLGLRFVSTVLRRKDLGFFFAFLLFRPPFFVLVLRLRSASLDRRFYRVRLEVGGRW